MTTEITTPEQASREIEVIRRRMPQAERAESISEIVTREGIVIERMREQAKTRAESVDWWDLCRYESADSMWRKSGLGEREMRAAANPYPRDKATDWWQVYDHLESALGTGMLFGLVGKNGTGKNVMAAMLIREHCNRGGKFPIFISAPALFRQLHAAREAGDENDGLGKYLSTGLLVIDEAHERANTDYEDRRLAEIVNVRYGRLRDTVLITNLAPAEFAKTLGNAVIDRMRQCGGIIECNWPSYRRASA